ncbi:FRG domain-containing protein [Shewanella algae]|uniref:FRG domain-containing protein n=1 Tax=Shewanella algae TaxID=38313 RepID=UPI0005CCA1D6|nr:FRG domain-containing protein [Shewanella algae]
MLSDIFHEIQVIENQLGGGVYWYRGHSSENYSLTPSALRNGRCDFELQLFYDYKMYSASLRTQNKSNWDLLLDMQHYGIPTRLLDWTTNLGTALFFALRNNPSSPCIWVLSPFNLNKISTGYNTLADTAVIGDRPAESFQNYGVHNILSSNTSIEKPFAIHAPHGNPRLAMQRGMFTVHGKSKEPLEVSCPQVVRRVDIPHNIIPTAKQYLAKLGIDEFSLFPDHEGLSKFLKTKYNLNS